MRPYVCVCVCLCVRVSMRPCICASVHPCVCASVRLTVYTYVRTYLPAYLPAYLPTYLPIHACMHACTHAYMHTCIHAPLRAHSFSQLLTASHSFSERGLSEARGFHRGGVAVHRSRLGMRGGLRVRAASRFGGLVGKRSRAASHGEEVAVSVGI